MTDDQIARRLDRLAVEYALARSNVKAERRALAAVAEQIDDLQQAQLLVQEVAAQLQTQAHLRIAAIVCRCLETIFAEDAYTFSIRFDKKRGKTSATLILARDGIELDDPKNEAGGGVVDIAAFALRLTCLLLALPRRRRVLILDEPIRNLHGEEYQNRVGALLLALAKEMKVQFIIITDDNWLKIGHVVHIRK